jgi:hypothetical protein
MLGAKIEKWVRRRVTHGGNIDKISVRGVSPLWAWAARFAEGIANGW